jgi:hypothetical protein
MSFLTDLKFAFRSFARAKGLALTVIVTLALGIGANAAMFSVVRGVLLRPLVNRDESRLIDIRQGAPGNDVENATFSVPELVDLRALEDGGRDWRLLDDRPHDGRPGRASFRARGGGRRLVRVTSHLDQTLS